LVYLTRDSLTLVSCYLWSSILYCIYTIKFFNTWIVSFSLYLITLKLPTKILR